MAKLVILGDISAIVDACQQGEPGTPVPKVLWNITPSYSQIQTFPTHPCTLLSLFHSHTTLQAAILLVAILDPKVLFLISHEIDMKGKNCVYPKSDVERTVEVNPINWIFSANYGFWDL